MPIGIVDAFEGVHVRQDQRKAVFILRIQVQYPVERPAVEQLRQRVVLCLMLHQHLPLLVFRVDAVVGLRERLQLLHTMNRRNEPVADILIILQQRANHAAADDQTRQKHHHREDHHADNDRPQHPDKNVRSPVLARHDLVGQHRQGFIHIARDLVLGALILRTDEHFLRPVHLFRVREGRILCRQDHISDLLRPFGPLRVGRLLHQAHRIVLRLHQLHGGGKRLMQGLHGCGVIVQRGELIHRLLAAARHIGLFKVGVDILLLPRRRGQPHLLGQHIRPLLQLMGRRFTGNVIL